MRTMKVDPRNKINDLDGKEWVKSTASVWYQRGLGKEHPHAHYEKQHPAPFAFLMVERLLKFFTKKGDVVLDPFCGVGSTLKACALNGRRGIGIELGKKWAALAKKRLANEANEGFEQELICGDCREVLPKMKSESVDFIVTSPPYWGILAKPADYRVKEERISKGLDTKYSDDERDLGNIEDYERFLDQLGTVFAECYRILANRKYMVVVVSDFRHGNEFYHFHSDVVRQMEHMGFTSKGLIIYVKNAKKLYPYGYPYDFVPSIIHEYLLVFRREQEDSI